MNLPPQLEAKFQTLEERYPLKRSALIPMLLYAQDQFGYVSDEMIGEIASRIGLNALQVTETMAYYSMLRRLHRRAGHASQLRFLRKSHHRTHHPNFRGARSRTKASNLHADHGLGERAASRRSARHQPPLRRQGFTQAGGLRRA